VESPGLCVLVGVPAWQDDGVGEWRTARVALEGAPTKLTITDRSDPAQEPKVELPIAGAVVRRPSSQRSGHPHCFRIDLERAPHPAKLKLVRPRSPPRAASQPASQANILWPGR
jgi:hypothetical protein